MSGLRKATRQKAKIRLGLSAVAGGGKSYSGLLIAKGLAKGDMSKVVMIDTENGSGDLYAHLGDYSIYPLSAPFTPEKYIKALKECEEAGMEVCLIDSITHEWNGKGGILEIHSALGGNSFAAWKTVTPRHENFKQSLLNSNMHIITTVRRKQDYVMELNESGKQVPVKVGLKEETREGWEYELTTNLELSQNHLATASKDRTGLFMGQPAFIPEEETGRMILEWCESGAAPIIQTETIDRHKESLDKAVDLKSLKSAYEAIPLNIRAEYEAQKEALKIKLTPAK